MEACVLLRNAGGSTMRSETILFISNCKISNYSVLAALNATGHQVLSTSSTQAPAFLFVMHCIAAVLLDHCGSENSSFEVARNLRKICRRVPIILLSSTPINPLPPDVDACVSTALPLTNLTSAVLRVLGMVGDRHQADSLQLTS
jgi:CheY-like chemotaxis protein